MIQVNVVPSPTVAPIVAPRISEVPQKPVKPAVENNSDDAPMKVKTSPPPVTDLKLQPLVSSKPAVPSKPRDTAPTTATISKNDCSEITKIDKTSQDTIKQFTKAVNEKISVRLIPAATNRYHITRNR